MAIDKKELREQYKQMRPPMGCFALSCDMTEELFIGWATNLESAKNSLLFRLSIGGLLNEPLLQSLYTLHGGDHFSFSVLEVLPYDKDDEAKDYKDDLAILASLYLEKFAHAKEIQVWKYQQR